MKQMFPRDRHLSTTELLQHRRILLLPLVASVAALLGCVRQPANRDSNGPPASTRAAPTPEAISKVIDPIVERAMAKEGIPGAAFVFVHEDRIVYARGYGLADREHGIAVDVARTPWPIASITKVFTGMAALQLVEGGQLALDQDINRYLRQVSVPEQGLPPITLAHLLSHTAGLDELPGRQFDPDHARPALGEFLKTHLVRYRAPGSRTAYSTYAIAVAGIAVEDASGVAYEDFVRTRILEPCEMRSARFLLRKGDEHGVATPYRLDNGMASVMPHEWYVTTSTSSLVATATDMARFAMLHLSDGECAGRQILGKSLVRAMRTQQATVHPAVPGWGYALQLDEVNGRKVAEHGGDIGGFSSLLVLIPEEHAGFFVVNHGEGNDLRFAIKSALFDGLYPASHARTAPQPDPAAATSLREYAGRYRSSLACHTCPNVGQEQDFELTVGSGGVLQLWGQQWVPLEHDLFVRTDGTRLLGFARDDGGRIAAVSGGSWRVADRLSE